RHKSLWPINHGKNRISRTRPVQLRLIIRRVRCTVLSRPRAATTTLGSLSKPMVSAAERAELWVGAAVLAVAAGFLIWSTSGGRTSGLGGGYELRAAFPNVSGIEVGTDVRVAGVRVGRVAGIELDSQTYLAEARLRLPES